MKSYVEPLNAEEALEVLKKYGIPCDSAQPSGDGTVKMNRSDGMITCSKPDELAAAVGSAATNALETHKAFAWRQSAAISGQRWRIRIGFTISKVL